jgi:hypothetical protein
VRKAPRILKISGFSQGRQCLEDVNIMNAFERIPHNTGDVKRKLLVHTIPDKISLSSLEATSFA